MVGAGYIEAAAGRKGGWGEKRTQVKKGTDTEADKKTLKNSNNNNKKHFSTPTPPPATPTKLTLLDTEN